MTVYHVGGLNPIHRVKTLKEAVQKAQHGDTISIHKNIKEAITITKTIIIEGNNHIITAENGKTAVLCEKPIHLNNVKFKVESHANALVLQQGGHLTGVSTQLIGPLLEIYPAIYVTGGQLTLTDSHITKLYTDSPDITVTMNNSTIGSYYPDYISTISRDERSLIQGTLIANKSTISHTDVGFMEASRCSLGPFLDIRDGKLLACTLNRPEPITKKPSRKEPDSGPLKDLLQFSYLVALRGNVSIEKGYRVHPKVPKSWIGFYGNGATIAVTGARLKHKVIQHQINESSLSFENAIDANRWELRATTPSLVKAKINMSKTVKTAMDLLDELIGLTDVKEFVKGMIVDTQFAKKTEHNFGASYHMVFAGNPGSAKTTVARLVAQALFEAGVLPENKLVEASADTLIKGYVGQTGENVQRILEEALGGVLFIDEAYQLASKDGQNSFNEDVLGPLLRYMEDKRDELVVIAAGYPQEMREFVASNPGLARRFNWVNFEDYSSSELADIFELIRAQHEDDYVPGYTPDLIPLFDELTHIYLSTPDAKGRITNGGNGGLSRNVYQAVASARNKRVISQGLSDYRLAPEDILAGFDAERQKAITLLERN